MRRPSPMRKVSPQPWWVACLRLSPLHTLTRYRGGPFPFWWVVMVMRYADGGRRSCTFEQAPPPSGGPSPTVTSVPPFLGPPTRALLPAPPKDGGPVVVRARFELLDINEINDGAETFEFTGVLTLTWHDPRQAFDPVVVGVDEKIFQGSYQFNELATGWYPQVVLVSASGLYQKNGVVLRVQPDGTSTLIETLNATAKTEFNMRRFPFDGHRLEAVFDVLGFDREEVLLQVESEAASAFARDVRLPQWTITGVSMSVQDRLGLLRRTPRAFVGVHRER